MNETISPVQRDIERKQFKQQWETAMQKQDLPALQNLVRTYLVDENSNIRTNWVDSPICVLFVGYQIMMAELENNSGRYILQFRDNATWIQEYYQIKFMLRRMEYHSEPDICQDVYHYLKEHEITIHAIRIISEKSIINRELLLCRLAYTAFSLGHSEEALSYLLTALDWNEHNIHTLYTLCYILLQMGEITTAQGYFRELQNLPIPAIEELKQVLFLPSLTPDAEEIQTLRYEEILTFCSKSITYNAEQNKDNYKEFLDVAPLPTTFSFILCVGNETYYEEARWYLNQLYVPEHCHLQIVPVRGANSIASGYNQGMQEANRLAPQNTKQHIKIYIHQDIMVTNRYLLYDLLKAQKEAVLPGQKLGILGVIGTDQLPLSGIWWESESYFGGCMEDRILLPQSIDGSLGCYEYAPAEGMDGIFLATYEDLPWREDLFCGWHFYDISQCQEFLRAGYAAAIVTNSNAWCLHDCKVEDIEDPQYEENRRIFLKEYHSGLKAYQNS